MSKVKSKIRKLKGKEEEETRADEAKQQGSELLCCVPDVKGRLLIVLSESNFNSHFRTIFREC